MNTCKNKLFNKADKDVNITKSIPKPFWDTEVEKLQKEKQMLYSNLKKALDDEVDFEISFNLYEKLRKINSKIKKKIKKNKKITKVNKLYNWIKMAKDNPKMFWRVLKNSKLNNNKLPNKIRKPSGDFAETKNEILDAWEDHFNKIHNININKDEFLIPDNVRNEILDKEFTIEEIESKIKELKNLKTSSNDGIVNEFLKGSKNLNKALCSLFNKILLSGQIPEGWNQGIIIPLYKGNGDLNDPSNYRGITLLPCINKLFEAILNDRIWLVIKDKISPLQAGFVKKHRTLDQILILDELKKKAVENKTNLFVAYVDVKTAYDGVDRNLLYKILLEKFNFSSKILNYLKNLHMNHEVKVLTQHGLSKGIKVGSGVPQGSITAPLLYTCFINDLLIKLEREDIGAKIGDIYVGGLAFADDLALCATNASDLRKLLKSTTTYADEHNYKLNVNKTKVQIFNFGSKIKNYDKKFNLYNNKIEIVNSFKYLGVDIDNKTSNEESIHIERLCNKAKQKLGLLCANGLISKQNPIWINLKIIKATIIPILFYGCEMNWPKKRNSELLERTVRIIYKRACGCDFKTTNEFIYGELGLLKFISKSNELKLRYFCKVMKEKDRLIYKVIDELSKNGNCNFRTKVEKLINNYNLNLEDLLKLDLDEIYNQIKSKIVELEKVEWGASVENKPKLRFYKRIKNDWGLEDYIFHPHRNKVDELLRLRSGTNSLEIEKGRHSGKSVDERVCRLCLSEVEDEEHFLGYCPSLEADRQQIFSKITNNLESHNWSHLIDLNNTSELVHFLAGQKLSTNKKFLKFQKNIILWAVDLLIKKRVLLLKQR